MPNTLLKNVLAHIITREWEHFCYLNLWPNYFKIIVSCGNPNFYETRLKVACFFALNYYDYDLLIDSLIVLNPNVISLITTS